jgi:uncharacterized protein YchJ
MDNKLLEEKLTALGETEMQMFRFMLDRPAGAILTIETDKMLAQILAEDGLAEVDGDKVVIPAEIRDAYRNMWSDELTLKWRKRNWMYKCLEAGRYLYGVMTWDVLKDLFALRYPHSDMDEVKELFASTPVFYQWFTERDGQLVLNGYEKDDYYKYLLDIQKDIPFYIPSKEEVEELYDRGCLISRESHAKLKEFIDETFGMGPDAAELKMARLYQAVNDRARVNDAVNLFLAGDVEDSEKLEFPSDEAEVKFIELYMEMSRECRVRDNRGHDWYEMTAIMAEKNRSAEQEKKAPVKRVKIGRNEPCPCGSGRKYKNCCGRNIS